MPTLEQLEKEINGLKENSTFEFFDAYDNFIATLKTSSNGDKAKLRAILATFRTKLQKIDLVQFDSMRKKAKKLDEALVAESVSELIKAINNRNHALATLVPKLKDEIKKGNADAELLKKIKEGFEKATKTIDELKNLVDQLTATDVSIKSSLKALIEAAGNISSTFMPDEENEES